jgi:hypothetical protein
MKTLYKAAVAAICVLGAVGIARADKGPDVSGSGTPSDAAISATAVGGMPSAGSQSGGPRLTRAQVKQELIRAQKSGALDRLNQFYGGGQ